MTTSQSGVISDLPLYHCKNPDCKDPEWVPRKLHPKHCPSCKSVFWNDEEHWKARSIGQSNANVGDNKSGVVKRHRKTSQEILSEVSQRLGNLAKNIENNSPLGTGNKEKENNG